MAKSVYALLKYSQLPENYAMSLSSASEERLEILNGKLERVFEDKGHSMYVEGTAEPIFKFFGDKFGLSNIWGINFSEYFAGVFDNTDNYNVIPRRVVIIYNVGYERAVNTAFSSRLLRSLIKDLTDKGSWVIIESYLPYQKFHTQYDIEFVNKITIPIKKAQSFL